MPVLQFSAGFGPYSGQYLLSTNILLIAEIFK